MIRVDNNKIIFINLNTVKIYIVESKDYDKIIDYVLYGRKNNLINNIIKMGLGNELEKNKFELMNMLKESLKFGKLKNSLIAPLTINIEVTTKCHLKCPQCYCHLEEGKHIEMDIAKKYIYEASKLQVPAIGFSGGETLEYNNICELIKCCKDNNIVSSIAISGAKLNEKKLDDIINSGIGMIYVSLNSSTRELNSISRDGFELAINALELLVNSNFENYAINWVAHDYNISDFENVINLARKYKVKKVVVLSLKPDSNNKLEGVPSKENFKLLGNYIKKFKDDNLDIQVESCYSPLIAYINKNEKSILNECGSGRYSMAISVDGRMMPCRHIEVKEKYTSIQEYWNESSFLKQVRDNNNSRINNCENCSFANKCVPCTAIQYNINNTLKLGNEYCSLRERE